MNFHMWHFQEEYIYKDKDSDSEVLGYLQESKKITKDEKEYAEAQRLIEILRYFEPISKDIVPSHSLLKEFLGGGDFKG